MKYRFLFPVLLTALAVCFSACGGNTAADEPDTTSAPTTEATAAETSATESPTENRTSYRCQKFDFSVSDAFVPVKADTEYQYAFRKTEESEADMTLIGIMEVPDQHMSAAAFSEGLIPGFEEEGFQDIQAAPLTAGDMDCYRFTGSYTEDGITVRAGYTCVSEGDGSLFIIFATYTENAMEDYEAEILSILESLDYTGKAAGTGGTAKLDHFSLDYSDRWYLSDHSSTSIELGYRVARTECEYLAKISAELCTSGLTPQDAAMQKAQELRDSGEVTSGTGVMLGRDVTTVSYTREVLTHKITFCFGYFEENDVVYQITFRYCEDSGAVTEADLAELTLQ